MSEEVRCTRDDCGLDKPHDGVCVPEWFCWGIRKAQAIDTLRKAGGKPCPECGEATAGAMYFGLPGWACANHDEALAGGLGPDLAARLGFVGALLVYMPGDYWGALWRWVTGRTGEVSP